MHHRDTVANRATQTQRRLLQFSARPLPRAALLVAVLIPVLFLIMAALNLHAAVKLGEPESRNLSDQISTWYQPDPKQAYSGLTLIAVQRVERAFLFTVLGLVFGLAYAFIVAHQRKLAVALSHVLPP